MNLTGAENQIKPISLKANVLVQELEKELLLYDLKRDKVFCLNETALMVWNLCDGENTVEHIRREVSLRFNTEIGEEFIWLALDKLKSEQLLSNHQEFTINFNSLNRREVIKKAGLASMIALPLILTIVSPNAASAQSQGVCSSTFCTCQDLTCMQLGDPAFLQDPCVSANCSGGGTNCVCVGRFFCDQTDGVRFGMCGLV